MNTTIKTLKTTKSAMMRPLDHGYFEPPHWRARRRHTMAGTKTMVPKGSNCRARALNPIESSFVRVGDRKKRLMTTKVTAPMGKLM